MQKLIARFEERYGDDKFLMLTIAAIFQLPYVNEDLVDIMEIWGDEETNTVFITLITEDIELYKYDVVWTDEFLYPDLLELTTYPIKG